MVVKIDVQQDQALFSPLYGFSYSKLTGYCPTAILVPGYLLWGSFPLVNWCNCSLIQCG